MKKRVKFDDIIRQHMKILRGLQYESGLFAASRKDSKTGYDKSWLRDNFYECLAFEVLNDWKTVEKTYSALLRIFLKHEYKLDFAIEKKPEQRYQYIHARFHPMTFEEFWEDWGNKQNDSVGAILFRIGVLETHNPGCVLKNGDHYRVVNKLVRYLESIEYWNDEDSGMWEEDEEVHSSSVGACVAGLRAISKIDGINVPKDLISKGRATLKRLLPRESAKKFVDLALLSLIWPYNVVTKKQREDILRNIEFHLVKKRGVIRYKNDHYYNKNEDGYSEEAEWCFGFSWLAIIYEKLGDKKKASFYIKKAMDIKTAKGIPELYFSNSSKHNENTPLGWAESLFIISLYYYNEKYRKKNILEKIYEKLIHV